MKKIQAGSNDVAAANAYVAALPRDVAAGLRKLRHSIANAVPGAQLGVSYGIPAFKLKGRVLVWFAAFQEHSSFFPGATAIRVHAGELKGYQTSKGTIRFPHGKPLPARLVARLVKTRISELEKGKA